MLGLGNKISSTRFSHRMKGAFMVDTEDGYYVANTDDEFSNWDNWTIAIWLNTTSWSKILGTTGSEIEKIFSLSDASATNKGFMIGTYGGNLYLFVGNGTADTYSANNMIPWHSTHNVQQSAGSHVLIVARREAAEEEITLNTYSAYKNTSDTDSGVDAHWGDLGDNVHLVVGGVDDTNSGVNIDGEWTGNSRVAQIGMWKSFLSDANLTTIWESKNTPLTNLGIGTIRHCWAFNEHALGPTATIVDTGGTVRNLTRAGDAIIRSW
tara:strand:- start:183 stop:980 length:798 start_codon:yes stop_codon:yes gene_type:complete